MDSIISPDTASIALATAVWLIVGALRTAPRFREIPGPIFALGVGLVVSVLFIILGAFPLSWVGITRVIIAILAPQGLQAVGKSAIGQLSEPSMTPSGKSEQNS